MTYDKIMMFIECYFLMSGVVLVLLVMLVGWNFIPKARPGWIYQIATSFLFLTAVNGSGHKRPSELERLIKWVDLALFKAFVLCTFAICITTFIMVVIMPIGYALHAL